MLDTENQKLNSFVADSHQWLCKNPEEKNQKVSVKCILPYLFLLLCTKIFYTKKLNAVLINSVCSFNWSSSKSEDFVRNKCKLFFNSLKLLILCVCNEIVLLDS